ncbi:NAD-dependent epimerase/dehydratase family protein, partial [Salmonella enterica subsp. enterica serovar Kentucky]|nr:NAD-dependent epimerase/dehydratase family protein [Salmonella enterica subsp. enterica serovar Kentucky]
VLGASGYIGQHLAFALSQQGHQVRAAARRVERLEKQRLANVSCHKVDHCSFDGAPVIFFVAKHREIIGVFPFLAPGRHLIRTSSQPPYGATNQKFTVTNDP